MGIPNLVKSYKGKYKIQNIDKYVGNHKSGSIKFLSRWERQVMKMLDNNPNVLQWASEPFPVMYESPVDGKARRYYPDFYVRLKKRDGVIVEGLIEVKPKMQTVPPTKRKRKSKRLLAETATFAVNTAKWAAATNFCQTRNWFFKIMTEDDIFG